MRCSMKCETPPSSSGSSREPAAIHSPRATERTLVEALGGHSQAVVQR